MRGTVGVWVVVFAAVVGCGPGKQLPEKGGSTPSHRSGPDPDAPPAVSEPAAKEVVARMLDAATEKNPYRVEKAKASKSAAKGVMQQPVLEQIATVETARHIQAVWPDRCRWVLDFKSELLPPITVGARRPVVWMRRGGEPVALPDPRAAEEVAMADNFAQHWLLTLLPLTDPKAVVYAAGTGAVDSRPADTVKLALPGFPVCTLSADKQTGLLTQVEYANAEGGALVRKVLTLGDHKPFGGIQLPTRTRFNRNGNVVERWTIDSWEFPDKIDDAAFDAPK